MYFQLIYFVNFWATILIYNIFIYYFSKSDLEARHHRAPLPDAYVEDFIPPHVDFYHHHRPEYWPPHHGRPLPHFPGHPMDFHAAPRRNPYYPYPPPDPYYHPGLKPHHRGLPPKYPPNREVIVQRSEKSYR